MQAYEGGLQATFQQNLDARELENKVKYEYLKAEYETKQIYAAGLTKCALKNKYYMPSNGSADIDGCYDVLGYLNNKGLTGTEATYSTSIVYADARMNQSGSGQARFLADYLCSQANSGSRAMRAGDIAYLKKTNGIPIGNTEVMLVFGVSKGANVSTAKSYNSFYWESDINTAAPTANCNNYTDITAGLKTTRLYAPAAGIRGSHSSCNAATRLVCITD